MRKIIYTIILFQFLLLTANAQFKFKASGKVLYKDKPLKEAIITLYKDSVEAEKIITKADGKFLFNSLQYKHEYILSIAKQGFITKKLIISLNELTDEKAKNFRGSGIAADFDLFKTPTVKSLASQLNLLLAKPVGRMYYDPNKDEMAFDEKYTKAMLLDLNKVKELQETLEKIEANPIYAQAMEYINNLSKENEDQLTKITFLQKDKEIKEKEKQLQDAQLAQKETQIKQEKTQRYTLYGGLALLFVFGGFMFNRFKITQKQNKIISEQKDIVEEKQKEILDSIEYALRIQTAILPPQKIVKQYLENSFILYKPKDIVAGDFYWMETVNDLVLFAACDCTGHGVPGAMVSVVCHNALNRAVREFGLTQPAAILDKTAEIVIENFSKSEEDIKDGMDISLCAYNVKTKELQWAGANNPLWLLQNGELIETKADKQPIGMNENSKPFTNHTFNLTATDSIYLFTDGFADQFGGDTGQKKLTKKRFKDLILSIQEQKMQEQGIALDKFITEYRKEVEQIDDILVMGVKI